MLKYIALMVAIIAGWGYVFSFASAAVIEDYSNAGTSGIVQPVCLSCPAGASTLLGLESSGGFQWTPATTYTLQNIYLPLVKAGANATPGQYPLSVEIRSGVTTGSFGTLLSSASYDMANTPTPHSKNVFSSPSLMASVDIPDVQLNAGTEYTVIVRGVASDTNIRVNGAPSGVAGSIRYLDYQNNPAFISGSFTAGRNFLLFATEGELPVPPATSTAFIDSSTIIAAVTGGVQGTGEPLWPLASVVGVPMAFIIGRRVVSLIKYAT